MSSEAREMENAAPEPELQNDDERSSLLDTGDPGKNLLIKSMSG